MLPRYGDPEYFGGLMNVSWSFIFQFLQKICNHASAINYAALLPLYVFFCNRLLFLVIPKVLSQIS